MGEPAGIGGEITLKSWLRSRDGVMPAFFVIDDADRLGGIAQHLGWPVPVEVVTSAAEAKGVFARALPVLHRPLATAAVAGRPDARNGHAVIDAIETAVALVRAGEAAAVVTNPIHKAALYRIGFRFPGHTEFLAALAGIACAPVMMLASPRLRVVPVTVHLSLRGAIEALTTDAIVHAATVTADALHRDFGIDRPRLAIAGLNPHAGEDGEMGDEDDAIVRPAVARIQALGIDASGPLPPDTMFDSRARLRYDAAICMYHDQALIPLKTLDVDQGVNVTLGLPFIRTSPDHGTALGIAGRGEASEESLLAALRLAANLTRHRAATDATLAS